MAINLINTKIEGIKVLALEGTSIVAVPINKSASAYDIIDLNDRADIVARVQKANLNSWCAAYTEAAADRAEIEAAIAAKEERKAMKAAAKAAEVAAIEAAQTSLFA